jgi:hypothetical protein
LEARPLAVPTGLARDLSQLALGDQRCVLGWEQQDVFLDCRRKLPENDDLAAAFSRRCPSTTSPLLRARIGILNPNSWMEAIIRATAWSFLRGLRL